MSTQILPALNVELTNIDTVRSAGLRELAADRLVLYFYPKDNTPGCTTQAQDFRDNLDAFKHAGATVIGVSRDSIKSHQNFIAKFALNFELIADPSEALCNALGVMKLKNMYGKQVRGIERSTFVFAKNGELLKEWRGLKVPNHVAEVLAFVQTLKK